MTPDPSTVREITTRWQTTRDRGDATTLDDLCGGNAALIAAVKDELARWAAPAPGSGTVTSPAETTGSTLRPVEPHAPAYRLIRVLGTGAFGTVWLAEDSQLQREVALKTIRVPTDHPAAGRHLDMLRHEARQLAKVDHPHVIRVHAWWQLPGVDYLVMQYVAGGTLADRLRTHRRLPWEQAARYVADVADGLKAIHATGLVHRDVKPANILWQVEADRAILGDLGVAERFGQTSRVAGSLPYMAPEAFAGVVAPAADVFALGATYFHLVTGEVPFPGPTPTGDLPTPDPRLDGIPAGIEAVLRSSLAADASRRPTMAAFAADLRGQLNQSIADSFVTETRPGLHLDAFRVTPTGIAPVAARRPTDVITRDLKRVPPPPDRATLRTGEVLRLQVRVHRPGYLSVWNVGPTGNLTQLFPESGPGQVEPGTVHVLDAELTPPAGRERVVAILTHDPVPVRPTDLAHVRDTAAPPAATTRDLKRIQSTLDQLPADRWAAAVLELDHGP